ncbi:class I SAM-dependent methyltransferase [Patescibacteria group bacterium]|nr:class I SAM-dependent methyltransferase [Patescibacteria group bacterium]
MEKTKCPVCEGNRWEKYLVGKGFVLERCQKCGLIKTVTKKKNRIYESRKEALSQFGEDRSKHEKYAKELLDYLPISKGSLLDIGAGTGFLVKEANKRGFKAEGVEPAKVFVAVGAKKLGVKIQATSLEKFKARKKYDAIILKHVIEHVPDLNTFLGKCQKLLKPGGIILISCPNIRSLMYFIFRQRWYGLQPSQHLWQFSPATLHQLLENNVFNNVNISVINMDYQVPGIKGAVFALLLIKAKVTGLGDQLVAVAKK